MEHWQKNLRIMWICQFMALVGMNSVIPFLPLFVRELGVTEIQSTSNWSGLVFSAPFFISFFLTPVWGSLGDKYGRKIMVIRAIFGLALAQMLIGFSQNVYHLFFGRVLQGILSGFLPSVMALIASNTPKQKVGYALGTLQSATAAGTVVGPLIGGLISNLVGFRSVFFLVSALLTATGLLVIFLVKEDVKVSGEKRYGIAENLKLILSNKLLLTSAVFITLSAFGFALVRPVFVLYIETFDIKSNLLPTITGAVYSIVGIFTTLSASWWGKRAESKGIYINLLLASLLTGSMYLLHFFVKNLMILIPVRIFLGFGLGAMLPLLFTSISNNIPFDRKGGVLGIASSFQILGNMFGPLAGGFIGGFIGVRFSFMLSGLVFIAISLLLIKFFKR